MRRVAAVAAAAGLAAGDVKFSRTISAVGPGVSFDFVVDGGACKKTDAYGSDSCVIKTGATYSATLSFSIPPTPLGAAARYKVDSKITYKMLPLNFKIDCAVCGADCTFTVPIVGTPVTIPMPPCPLSIPGGKFGPVTHTIHIPAGGFPCPIDSCPASIPKFSAKGDILITDGSTTLISASFTASSDKTPIVPKPCPAPCQHFVCNPHGSSPGVCFATHGNGPQNQAQCQAACGGPSPPAPPAPAPPTPPTPGAVYQCEAGRCVAAAGGAALPLCQAVCGGGPAPAPPPPAPPAQLYQCNAGVCVAAASGVALPLCTAGC